MVNNTEHTNYKQYIEYLELKYEHSNKYYKTISQGDSYHDFLYHYEAMLTHTIYPRPLVMDIPQSDTGEMNTNECANKMNDIIGKRDEKIKEFQSKEMYNMVTKYSNTRKVRRFFDYEIRDKVGEILKGTYVTNAWIKLHEILHTFPLLTNCNNKVNTFHICEHPGAFIYSITDYLKRNCPDAVHDFIFQSLKPTGKEKIFKAEKDLLEKHKKKLDYGPKNTGDITDPDNIKYYYSIHKMSKWDFITSDCGLDCSNDFTQQESVLVPIYTGAFLTAIGISRKGSHYVFKMFTFNSPQSISLLSLCTEYYEKVYMTRLLTTKSVSGEIYIVCMNFKYDNMPQDKFIDLVDKYSKKELLSNTLSKNIGDKLILYNDILTKMRITSINFIMFRLLNTEYAREHEQVIEYVKDSVNYYTNYYMRYIKLNK
jgi:23S rRNA U2552 (ribose-2'-O)-methylase RlmE/FtsJ